MPLLPGKKREVISHNIKEMIRSGHPQKQAIAASLAESRRKKKMAEGGIVESFKSAIGMPSIDEGDRLDQHKKEKEPSYEEKVGQGVKSKMDPDKARAFTNAFNGYAEGGVVKEGDYALDEEHERSMEELMIQGDQHPVSNPHEQDMEKKLAESLHKASEAEEYMYSGGLVEGMGGDETPEVMHDGTEEPMSEEVGHTAELEHSVIEGVPESMGLSKEAMEALAMKKKMRRFK